MTEPRPGRKRLGEALQQDADAWRNDRSRPVQARHRHAGEVRAIPVVVKRARVGSAGSWDLEAQ